MRDVAAHKWANGLAIEDPEREQRVLDSATDAALRHGLVVEGVERLFAVQIDAAKEVQEHWFARWQAGEAAPVAPDLDTELRPRLLTLGDAIVAAAPAPQAAVRLPAVEGLSATTAARLEAALVGLARYRNRLAQVLESGVLRVGTTGDYAPFSFRAGADDDYVGIDIDLAEDLAGSLSVELELVATAWPTLLDDLRAGRFDVAMSGVSRTLERQKHGYFSLPYHVGGKTAIGRCADAQRFSTLAAIDRPGVRVIVNPGGTNERFVDSRLLQAHKIVHPDNRSIFAELVAGRADVMFTDAIEVALKTREEPRLCRLLADLLSYQEKGFLLPQDEALRAFVDLWVEQRLGDGSVAEAFRRHGVSAAVATAGPR